MKLGSSEVHYCRCESNGRSEINHFDLTWTPIVANATYNLNDQMTAMQSNGVTESRDYNLLGQLTGISYNGALRHEYRYSATANDGRITSYKNHQSGEDVEYSDRFDWL